MTDVRGFVNTPAEWIEATRKGELRVLTPSSVVECSTPLTGDGLKLSRLQSYVSPPATVAVLPGGLSIGKDGAVATSDGLLILATVQRLHSPPVMHPAWYAASASAETIYFDGVLAVPTHNGSLNFAHVLADGVGRMWLLQRCGYRPDAWVVPETPPDWLAEMLDLIGICEADRLYVRSDTVIQARTLLLPSSTGFGWGTAPWARTAVYEMLKINRLPQSRPSKVWVSRLHSSLRRWKEEERASAALEERGFRICHLETLSLSTQLEIVCNSGVIAGVHGAGLAWALGSRCTTGLVYEVAPPTIVHNSFRSISSVIGWSYGRTRCADVGVHAGNDVHRDFSLEPVEVLASLDDAMAKCRLG